MKKIQKIVESESEGSNDDKNQRQHKDLDNVSDNDEWNGDITRDVLEGLSSSKITPKKPQHVPNPTEGRTRRQAALSATKKIRESLRYLKHHNVEKNNEMSGNEEDELKSGNYEEDYNFQSSKKSKNQSFTYKTPQGKLKHTTKESPASSEYQSGITSQSPRTEAYSTRGSSGRSALLSKEKLSRRQQAALEFKKRSLHTMDASSDEEYYDNCKESDDDDDAEEAVGQPSMNSRSLAGKASTEYTSSIAAMKKQSTISRFKSASKPRLRRERDEQKEEYYDYVDSDMDDFIAPEDEEEEDESDQDENSSDEVEVFEEVDDDEETRRKRRRSSNISNDVSSAPNICTEPSISINTGIKPNSAVLAAAPIHGHSRSSQVVNCAKEEDDNEDVASMPRSAKGARHSQLVLSDSEGSRSQLVPSDSDEQTKDHRDPVRVKCVPTKTGKSDASKHSKLDRSDNISSSAQKKTRHATAVEASRSQIIRKRRMIVDDDDESDVRVQEGHEGNTRDEENDGEDGDVSDDENDYGDDDEEDDGPLEHWQVNAMLDQQEDSGREAHGFGLRKNFSRQEAMQWYLQMMVRSMLDEDFLKRLERRPHDEDHVMYLSASRQIENTLCTSRESLLGSGAWKQDFLRELQNRPFYMSSTTSSSFERCSICGRSSHNANLKIHLFGTRVDSRQLYTIRWDKALPKGLLSGWDECFRVIASVGNLEGKCGRQRRTSLERNGAVMELSDDEDNEASEVMNEDEDNEEEALASTSRLRMFDRRWPTQLNSSDESTWSAAAHCRSRTQLYHTLLNYKLRLLLKVREWMIRQYRLTGVQSMNRLEMQISRPLLKHIALALRHCYCEVHANDIAADTAFVSNESERLEKILNQADARWGSKLEDLKQDIWRDARSSGERRVASESPNNSESPRRQQALTPSLSAGSSSSSINGYKQKKTVLDWLKTGSSKK